MSAIHEQPLARTRAYQVSRRWQTKPGHVKRITKTLSDWWKGPAISELGDLWSSRPSAFATSRTDQTDRNLQEFISATFTLAQVERILALRAIHVKNAARATRLLQAWVPSPFSHAQARSIQGLMALNLREMHGTLALGMESCELRDRLRTSKQARSPR